MSIYFSETLPYLIKIVKPVPDSNKKCTLFDNVNLNKDPANLFVLNFSKRAKNVRSWKLDARKQKSFRDWHGIVNTLAPGLDHSRNDCHVTKLSQHYTQTPSTLRSMSNIRDQIFKKTTSTRASRYPSFETNGFGTRSQRITDRHDIKRCKLWLQVSSPRHPDPNNSVSTRAKHYANDHHVDKLFNQLNADPHTRNST